MADPDTRERGNAPDDTSTSTAATYSSPLLAVPGAVPAPEEWPDQGVAWHCGDPLVEQREATTGLVVIDRSHRSVISVTGADRLTWLHSLTSQSFTDLPDGATAESLILDINGRIEHHFVATHFDGTVWLDTEREYAAALLSYLQKMVFWSKVEVREADMAVLTLIGPALANAIPDTTKAVALPEGGFTRPLGWPAEGRADAVVPRSQLARWWTEFTHAGARPAGTWALEALRVTSLRPRVGVDTDERTIPHEARWIGTAEQHGAVHLEKGCYRGQETVARVHNLGKPPRHLVLLHLDGSDEHRPMTGDPVTAGGRTVGRVGTLIDHFEFGPVALALMKRTITPETELTAGAPGREVAASIDPDSLPLYEEVQPGRAAVDKLRGR
ncbi:YgfZ/GcvT domain-containing protein [Hoyosella altamirensis]|uniref:GCVT N-terminal domain-containing protein n=1 Tax=Hoyosella altamirensis TaxID=616997 RepID=A0A839RMT3_9ACTN|nr:folate-binding protein YgfZ [Hoyosella altamirensis]MBB3037386.1 hypothetical protein [Hoyosella altamirensis]